MSKTKLVRGDRCKLKGNDYMHLKIHEILPKGSHGRLCILVKCLAVGGGTPIDFNFALIKTFRYVDLVRDDS